MWPQVMSTKMGYCFKTAVYITFPSVTSVILWPDSMVLHSIVGGSGGTFYQCGLINTGLFYCTIGITRDTLYVRRLSQSIHTDYICIILVSLFLSGGLYFILLSSVFVPYSWFTSANLRLSSFYHVPSGEMLVAHTWSLLVKENGQIDMGQVTKLWLSCYLVLLSIDSKTR